MLRETWWDGSVVVNGTTTTMGVPGGQALIIPENSIITDANTDGGFSGFLIDKTVESIIWWFNTQGDFTVPAGKTFYMFRETWWDGSVVVNGTTTTMGVPGGQHLIIPENSIITDANADGGFSGYLVDNNYFADCGGGSSSNSTVDSSYIDSLVQFYSSGDCGGCNLHFPEGFGDLFNVRLTVNQHTYTVPSGKRLYITHLEADNDPLYIDGIKIWSNLYQPLINYPIIVDENSIISKPPQNLSLGSISVRGFLVNISSLIQPITGGNTNYVVPNGKLLIVNFFGGKDNTTAPTNLSIGSFHSLNEEVNFPIILYSNDTLVTTGFGPTGTNGISFNGYLVDENYFADCGGGGGSSSSGGGNNNSLISGIVSQCGDTLFTSNGFIIIPEISQSNLRNHFSTSSVSDVDGNIYKTVIYGDDEWMVENLKTNVGDYLTWSQANSTNPPSTPVTFPDSIGHYYSSSSLLNVCPSGWHVPTVSEWQNLHSEIFCGNVMNPNGYTNPSNGYQENNYEILWSSDEQGGTNLSLFNLFSSGNYQNGIIGWGNDYSTHFWSTSNCGSNFYRINIPVSNSGTDFELDVGCTCASCGVYTQIRCVKD